ncbi:hypothetical protein N7528_002754 [Penicillium herquei]|nr:hypothetical protein N7528_002754 [Penicillium herquei]
MSCSKSQHDILLVAQCTVSQLAFLARNPILAVVAACLHRLTVSIPHQEPILVAQCTALQSALHTKNPTLVHSPLLTMADQPAEPPRRRHQILEASRRLFAECREHTRRWLSQHNLPSTDQTLRQFSEFIVNTTEGTIPSLAVSKLARHEVERLFGIREGSEHDLR